MTASLVPLQPIKSQLLQIYLGGQNITLSVDQRRYGLFVDLYLDNAIVRRGMQALNLVKLIRDPYLGVAGNFYFYDTAGTADPDYTGLGSRFVLIYDPGLT